MLGSLFIISSCSKNEDGIPNNTIRYNGKNYKIIYDSEASCELYFEAFSLGTTAFQAGTFTYGTTATNYFNVVQYFDYETFTLYEAISGSVVVTKLSGAREYRLQFNVVLDDASTLVGTVEGNFRYSYEGGRMGRVRQERGSEYFNVNKSSVRR